MGFDEDLMKARISQEQRETVEDIEEILRRAAECDWLRSVIGRIEIALSKLPSETDLSAVLGALGHDAPDEASAASLDLFQRYSGGLEDVRQLWIDMVNKYHQLGCRPALKHHAGFGESNP